VTVGRLHKDALLDPLAHLADAELGLDEDHLLLDNHHLLLERLVLLVLTVGRGDLHVVGRCVAGVGRDGLFEHIGVVVGVGTVEGVHGELLLAHELDALAILRATPTTSASSRFRTI